MNVVIRAGPLTAEAFAPFGQVLSYAPGDEIRRNFAAALFSDRRKARPNLRVQRSLPTPLPHLARVIERHPHSSQMFAPLSGASYLVLAFRSGMGGEPLFDSGCAFIARGDQAINYSRDVWHHGFMALNEGTFLMLRWEDGTCGDEEFLSLTCPIRIDV
jgi:ureidoglycolate lyase